MWDLCVSYIQSMWNTELNNMEWNNLVNPSQADGKLCVHNVLPLTFIWLAKGVSVSKQQDQLSCSKLGVGQTTM